jgi:tetratricopeptide (TPR) repeat protein
MLIESLEIFTKLGNIDLMGALLGSLGDLEMSLGNYQKSAKYYEKLLSHGNNHGYPYFVNNGLNQLGYLARLNGAYQKAEEFFKKTKDNSLQARISLGDLAWEMGHYDLAAQQYNSLLEYSKEINYKRGMILCTIGLVRISISKGNLGKAKAFLMESFRNIRSYQVHLSELLEAFATLLVRERSAEKATRLLGATHIWHTGRYYTRPRKECQEREGAISTARRVLGEEAFNVAWEAGAAMTIQQAVDYAMEILDA